MACLVLQMCVDETGTTMRLQHKTPILQQRPSKWKEGGTAAIRSASRMYPTGYETFFLPSKSRQGRFLLVLTPNCRVASESDTKAPSVLIWINHSILPLAGCRLTALQTQEIKGGVYK